MKIIKIENDREVMVVYPEEVNDYLTPEDKEMDRAARAAVEEALSKNNNNLKN